MAALRDLEPDEYDRMEIHGEWRVQTDALDASHDDYWSTVARDVLVPIPPMEEVNF
jgi:hypothetical protein